MRAIVSVFWSENIRAAHLAAADDRFELERKRFALLRLHRVLALSLDRNFLKTSFIILWIKDPSRIPGFE